MGGGCCIVDCCIADCGFCCIFDFCSDSGCSYHPTQNDTVDHSKIIADELAEMKARANNEGRQIGNEAVNNINCTMKNFIELIKTINTQKVGGKQLNIKIDVIERELEKLQKEVANFIGDRLNDRLVTTDKELSVILEERDDSKRSENFENFYRRVHKKAIQDLTKKTEEVIARQFALVDSELQNRLKEVDDSMQETLRNYKEAEKQKESKDVSLASKQIECMYKADLAEIVLDELNSAAK